MQYLPHMLISRPEQLLCIIKGYDTGSCGWRGVRTWRRNRNTGDLIPIGLHERDSISERVICPEDASLFSDPK